MKYSISQYTHDIYLLKAIAAELAELRKYPAHQQWRQERAAHLQRERLDIHERMYRYENQPQNKGKSIPLKG